MALRAALMEKQIQPCVTAHGLAKRQDKEKINHIICVAGAPRELGDKFSAHSRSSLGKWYYNFIAKLDLTIKARIFRHHKVENGKAKNLKLWA